MTALRVGVVVRDHHSGRAPTRQHLSLVEQRTEAAIHANIPTTTQMTDTTDGVDGWVGHFGVRIPGVRMIPETTDFVRRSLGRTVGMKPLEDGLEVICPLYSDGEADATNEIRDVVFQVLAQLALPATSVTFCEMMDTRKLPPLHSPELRLV